MLTRQHQGRPPLRRGAGDHALVLSGMSNQQLGPVGRGRRICRQFEPQRLAEVLQPPDHPARSPSAGGAALSLEEDDEHGPRRIPACSRPSTPAPSWRLQPDGDPAVLLGTQETLRHQRLPRCAGSPHALHPQGAQHAGRGRGLISCAATRHPIAGARAIVGLDPPATAIGAR